MKIKRFEDIVVWQKARELAGDIYRITGDRKFDRDWDLRSQMRRAANSIMANTVEGYERDSDAEFRRFLLISKGSSGELRSHLYLARDARFISENRFIELNSKATEIAKMIMGMVKYLSRSRRKKRLAT